MLFSAAHELHGPPAVGPEVSRRRTRGLRGGPASSTAVEGRWDDVKCDVRDGPRRQRRGARTLAQRAQASACARGHEGADRPRGDRTDADAADSWRRELRLLLLRRHLRVRAAGARLQLSRCDLGDQVRAGARRRRSARDTRYPRRSIEKGRSKVSSQARSVPAPPSIQSRVPSQAQIRSLPAPP